MAIIYTYPLKYKPVAADLVVITDSENRNYTKQASVQSIIDLFDCTKCDICSSTISTITSPAGDTITALACDTKINFTSSDASVSITGDAVTDTIDFKASGGGGGSCPPTYVAKPVICFDGECEISEKHESWIWTCDEALASLAPGYISNFTLNGVPIPHPEPVVDDGCWFIELATLSASPTTCDTCCPSFPEVLTFTPCHGDPNAAFATLSTNVTGLDVAWVDVACAYVNITVTSGSPPVTDNDCWQITTGGIPGGYEIEIISGEVLVAPDCDCECCLYPCTFRYVACPNELTPPPPSPIWIDGTGFGCEFETAPSYITYEYSVGNYWCYELEEKDCTPVTAVSYSSEGFTGDCTHPDICPSADPTYYSWSLCTDETLYYTTEDIETLSPALFAALPYTGPIGDQEEDTLCWDPDCCFTIEGPFAGDPPDTPVDIPSTCTTVSGFSDPVAQTCACCEWFDVVQYDLCDGAGDDCPDTININVCMWSQFYSGMTPPFLKPSTAPDFIKLDDGSVDGCCYAKNETPPCADENLDGFTYPDISQGYMDCACTPAPTTYKWQKCDDASTFVVTDVVPTITPGETQLYCCTEGDPPEVTYVDHCYLYLGEVTEPLSGSFPPCFSSADDTFEDCPCCINHCNWEYSACDDPPDGFPDSIVMSTANQEFCICADPVPSIVIQIDGETWCYDSPESTCEDVSGYSIVTEADCGDESFCPPASTQYRWKLCDEADWSYTDSIVDPFITIIGSFPFIGTLQQADDCATPMCCVEIEEWAHEEPTTAISDSCTIDSLDEYESCECCINRNVAQYSACAEGGGDCGSYGPYFIDTCDEWGVLIDDIASYPQYILFKVTEDPEDIWCCFERVDNIDCNEPNAFPEYIESESYINCDCGPDIYRYKICGGDDWVYTTQDLSTWIGTVYNGTDCYDVETWFILDGPDTPMPGDSAYFISFDDCECCENPRIKYFLCDDADPACGTPSVSYIVVADIWGGLASAPTNIMTAGADECCYSIDNYTCEPVDTTIFTEHDTCDCDPPEGWIYTPCALQADCVDNIENMEQLHGPNPTGSEECLWIDCCWYDVPASIAPITSDAGITPDQVYIGEEPLDCCGDVDTTQSLFTHVMWENCTGGTDPAVIIAECDCRVGPDFGPLWVGTMASGFTVDGVLTTDCYRLIGPAEPDATTVTCDLVACVCP